MTTIGASLTITGEVTSNEDVTIHGKVNGKIAMHGGSLLVAPGGNVQAEAQVGQLKIHGKFTGDVAASERVELSNTSQVNGTLVVNPGSVGQPRDANPDAAYAILDVETNTWEHRRIPYDVAAVQQRMRKHDMPERLVARLEHGW